MLRPVCSEMFGREDTRANAIDVFLDGFGQSFFEQRTFAREKLNRPTSNHDVFAFRRATFGPQVFVNRFGTDDCLVGVSLKSNKDVHIQSSHGLKIKRRPTAPPIA